MKTPSPDAYSPDYTKVKLRAPRSTVHVKPAEPRTAVIPGPADYSPDFTKIVASSPRPAMHIRPPHPPPDTAAGYRRLASTMTGLRFTIKNRETLDLAST
jgi:hypothetical protein